MGDVLGTNGAILGIGGIVLTTDDFSSVFVSLGAGLAGFFEITPSLLGSEITLGKFFTITGFGGLMSGEEEGNCGPITVDLVWFEGLGEGGEIFEEDEDTEDTAVEGLEDFDSCGERMEFLDVGSIS